MSEVKESAETFDFVGNRLCLDFVNTVDDRGSNMPKDRITSYNDLVLWSQLAGIITAEDAQGLLEKAKQQPVEATQVFQKAVMLREVSYRIFSAIALNSPPDPSDLQELSAAYAEAMDKACITQKDDCFTWDWMQKETALESTLWAIIRSAAELLTSTDLHLMHQCAADNCGWLFLDTSKNHSRRWCDMKGCGNRTKVGRHYERKKQKNVDA